MSTNNNHRQRVQGYLTKTVYDDFLAYCEQKGLNQSQAVAQLLDIALSREKKECTMKENFDRLESRVRNLEQMIIRTDEYLQEKKISPNSVRVTNQED